MIDLFRNKLMESIKNKDDISKELYSTLISNIRNKEIELKRELNNDECVEVLRKELKQVNETKSFANNRKDIIESCDKKIKILNEYLPVYLSDIEVYDIISESLKGISSINKGIAMKTVMPILKGKADNKVISAMVDKYISMV